MITKDDYQVDEYKDTVKDKYEKSNVSATIVWGPELAFRASMLTL